MTRNVRWQFVLVYTEPAAGQARAVEDVNAAVVDRRSAGRRRSRPAAAPSSRWTDRRRPRRPSRTAPIGKVLIDVSP